MADLANKPMGYTGLPPTKAWPRGLSAKAASAAVGLVSDFEASAQLPIDLVVDLFLLLECETLKPIIEKRT